MFWGLLLGVLLGASPARAGLGDGTASSPTAAPAEVGVLPAGVGLPVGSPAADAQLQDLEGRAVSLLGAAPGAKLVVFYKGGWCPYCNTHLRALAVNIDEFAARGVTPVAVSVDLPDAASVTQATWEIPYPVLSDPELAAHRAWRVVDELSGVERVMLGLAGAKIRARSGRSDGAVAVASMFYVDAGGVVRWAHADLELKERPTVAQILAAIDAAEGAVAAQP